MRTDIFLALLTFCFVTTLTPGPNNMMLMSSGVNFGVRRTLPHMAGVVLGYALMVGLVGFGLAGIFQAVPQLATAMRWLGAAYLAWLALKIARSGALQDRARAARPLGLLGAAAFQWINPKGWVMALSALTTYAVSANYATTVAVVTATCFAVAIPSSGAWVLFGASLRRWLGRPDRARVFNWAMAALLIASIAPIFWE